MGPRLCDMTDVLESTVAPSAIERAMEIFEKFKDRDHAALVQARKALTGRPHLRPFRCRPDRRAAAGRLQIDAPDRSRGRREAPNR